MIPYHSLKVSNQCIHSCSFCREVGEGFLSSESLRSFLNQSEIPESIRIFGGEPLLLDFLPELVASLRRRGARRVLIKTTAAPLSNFDLTYNLLGKGAHHFEVEFFSSNPQTHQAMTNNFSSLNLILQGISNLRRLTLESGQTPFLSFRIIVNSVNFEELSSNIDFLMQFRPDRFVVSLAPPLRELGSAIKKVKEAIKITNLSLVWLQTEGIPFCTLGEDFHHYGELLIQPYAAFSETNKWEECSGCQASTICQGAPSFFHDLVDFKLNPFSSSENAQDFEFLSKEKELL